MNKLIDFLLLKIGRLKKLSIEETEIYRYGLTMLLEIFINTIIFLVIIFCSGMIFEGLLFFCLYIKMRFCAGGVHLSSFSKCTFLSCISLVIILLMIHSIHISKHIMNYYVVLLLIAISIIGPIDDINRRLDINQRSIFAKKLKAYLVFVLVLYFIFYIFDLYSACKTIFVMLGFSLIVLLMGIFRNIVLSKDLGV